MPSTYAHFRAGQRLRARLTGTPKAAVEAHPELYNIGLHGPDILFYYEPYHKNRVSAVGYRQHEKSGLPDTIKWSSNPHFPWYL